MNWRKLIQDYHDGKIPASRWPDVEALMGAAGVEPYDISSTSMEAIEEVVTEHYAVEWVCTDTRVGLSIYVLKGEVVAVSKQACRKCSKDILFVSEDAFRATREFLRSFEEQACALADLDTELDSGWSVGNPRTH